MSVSLRSSVLRKFTWVLFFSLVSTFGAGSSNCKKKGAEPKPVAEAGEILISVKERVNLQAKPHEFKDLGGIATAEYTLENGPAYSDSRTRSFTGILRVPVRVKADQYLLTVSKLELTDPVGKDLVKYEGADLQRLKDSARFGVLVRVLVTKDGSQDPQVDEIPNNQPPPTSEPLTEFISIKKVFSNPASILTTADIEGTLRLLQGIASATEKYHVELLDLVKDAEQVDIEHLNLLVDACYFTFAAREAIAEQYKKLVEDGVSESEEAESERLRSNLALADQFARFTSGIVALGAPKLVELTYDEAKALIAKLLPDWGSTDSAVAGLLDKLGGVAALDAAQKLELMELSLGKRAQGTASGLAISWFNEDSDRAVNTLVELTKKFNYGAQDTVLLGTIPSLGGLSGSDAAKLAAMAYDQKLAVAQALLAKVKDLTVSDVLAIAATLSYGAKDRLLQDGLARLATVTAAEAAQLMAAAYEARLAIGLAALPKIPALTARELAQLAGVLSYGAKDNLLIAGLGRIDAMSAEDAALLAQTAYEQKLTVGKAAIRKVTGLDAAGVVLVASKLSYGSQDALVIDGISLLKALSEGDVVSLIRAGYEQKLKIAQNALALVASPTPAGLVSMAAQLSYGNKDTLLVKAADRLSRISAAEAASVTEAGYEQKLSIAKVAIRKVLSLNADGIALVVAKLSYGAKDTLALDGISLLSAVSEADVVTLIRSGYEQKLAIAKPAFAKVARPTPGGVVAMVAQLSYGNKDALLGAAIARLQDLKVEELQSLIGSAYETRYTVAQTLLPKLASPNATAVNTIAGMFNYGQRDALLRQGMGLLGAMSIADIALLARTSYEVKKTLVMDADRFVTALSSDELIILVAAAGAGDADVALKYLPKLSDLTAANAAKVAGALSYGYKNAFLAKVISSASRLTTDELVTIARATYEKFTETLTGNLAKLSDFNVENALKLAGLVSYGSKDVIILAYTAGAHTMDSGSLIRLSRATYEQKVRVIFENFVKIPNLKVAESILVSQELTYSNKDRLLLIAVDRVTDLTPTNALELSRAGYEQKDKILEKALKKLENNG